MPDNDTLPKIGILSFFISGFDDQFGHHLLGYADFIDDDPRAHNDKLKEFILLFQLDSQSKYDISWGDCGLANFLIHPDDLAKLDFSRVYYDWGCN